MNKTNEPQQESANKPNAIYEIDNDSVVSFVYDSLNNDAFSLTKAQFLTSVEHADFSSIYGNIKGNKAKIKWMISCLSTCMGNTWYADAAKSIDVRLQECSGANVAEYIKNKLNKEKIREKMKRRQ